MKKKSKFPGREAALALLGSLFMWAGLELDVWHMFLFIIGLTIVTWS